MVTLVQLVQRSTVTDIQITGRGGSLRSPPLGGSKLVALSGYLGYSFTSETWHLSIWVILNLPGAFHRRKETQCAV